MNWPQSVSPDTELVSNPNRGQRPAAYFDRVSVLSRIFAVYLTLNLGLIEIAQEISAIVSDLGPISNYEDRRISFYRLQVVGSC